MPYTCPINLFELPTFPFEVFPYITKAITFLYSIYLCWIFYFEGHIIFYSFCFALTCEMSLIFNSPSYFCVWLNTYAKRVEFSFLYQTSEEIDRMLQEQEKNITTQFCMQSFFQLDGKNLFQAHLLHPSFIKMQSVLRRTNRKFKKSSKIYISSPYITIGLFCSLFHFDFTRILMPAQSYWAMILYRSTKIYLHFVYLFLNSFLKICPECNIRDSILLIDPNVLLIKAVKNFFYT